MKALIVADQYECANRKAEITARLSNHGIETVFIDTVRKLPMALGKLAADDNKPFLFFRNVWEWVERPDEILKFHYENRGFESIYIGDEPITFTPLRAGLLRDYVLNISDVNLEQHGYSFYLESVKRTTERPNIAPPRIFVIAHNRHEYLKLTLNSLFFSIDDSIPVTLVLNQPTPAVAEVAKSFQKPNVEILRIEENCWFAAVNLAVQWYQPAVFMIVEDDFIFPAPAKEFYPNWAYLFALKTKQFDMVGWSPTVDNGPRFHRFQKPEPLPFGEWTYGGKELNAYPLLLGNALMVSLTFWKRAAKLEPEPWYTPLDHSLHRASGKYCTPNLRGYHIGWNQEMDGYGSLFRKDFKPPLENRVTNLTTGESRTLHLQTVLQDDW